MIEKIRSLFSATPIDNFEDWKKDFFQQSCHQWISSNKYIRSNIEDLFERLSVRQKNFFLKKKLQIVQSNGKWASAVRSEEQVIVIYPELSNLLQSVTTEVGGAILAHELGHFYYRHSEKKIDPLQAQVEADDFSYNLGYGKELISFLESMPQSEEKLIRLTYLTAKYFSEQVG